MTTETSGIIIRGMREGRRESARSIGSSMPGVLGPRTAVPGATPAVGTYAPINAMPRVVGLYLLLAATLAAGGWLIANRSVSPTAPSVPAFGVVSPLVVVAKTPIGASLDRMGSAPSEGLGHCRTMPLRVPLRFLGRGNPCAPLVSTSAVRHAPRGRG